MTLSMTRRLLVPLAALTLGGAAGCVDLKETPISGVTSAFYSTPAGFEAAVNAMYTPARTHWPSPAEFRQLSTVCASSCHPTLGFAGFNARLCRTLLTQMSEFAV